ncbi:hypothetical protein BKA93DRAFT_823524 [Sparassis latifolia]
MSSSISLDLDVLFMITFLLSSKDALALSLTCRQIHSFAKQHALSSVRLTSTKQLGKFCDSMFDGAPSCWNWVRRLDVAMSAFDVKSEQKIAPWGNFSDVPRLAELITHALNLEFLSIDCVEFLLRKGSPIGDAIASLTSLEELELHEADSQAVEMLRGMRSGLRKLVLHRACSNQQPTPQIFVSILPFQNLQVLELAHSWWPKWMDMPWDERWRWPTVRVLRLKHSKLSMAQLVRAFPNVRKLSIRTVTLPRESETRCWDSLDYVYIGHGRPWTSTLDWDQRITCPVHSLEFEDNYKSNSEEQIVMVNTIRETTPRVLSVTIKSSDAKFWMSLMATGAARLRYLNLNLRLTPRKRGTHLAQWLEKIPLILSTLDIICIRVCITSRNLSRAAMTVRWPLRLATCLPSLRYIAIARKIGDVPCMAEDAFWSRVSGPVKERRLQPVATHVGVRVHTYLHAGDMEALARLDETLPSPSGGVAIIDE